MELLPLWLAPNLVTLLGFFFILGNVALMVYYVPDMVGPVCLPSVARLFQRERWENMANEMGIPGTKLDLH